MIEKKIPRTIINNTIKIITNLYFFCKPCKKLHQNELKKNSHTMLSQRYRPSQNNRFYLTMLIIPYLEINGGHFWIVKIFN